MDQIIYIPREQERRIFSSILIRKREDFVLISSVKDLDLDKEQVILRISILRNKA